MDALISLVAAPAAAEALKSWGAFAIVLLMLGGLNWLLWARLRAREAEIAKVRADAATAEDRLRAEISSLQEKRLQDAQEMIRVAKTGTETMAARAAGDAEFRAALQQFVTAAMTQGAALRPDARLQLQGLTPLQSGPDGSSS